MKLIAREPAESFFDILLEIHENGGDYFSKIVSCRKCFDDFFREITKNEHAAFTGTYARTEFVLQTCGADQELTDKVHAFRKKAVMVAKGRLKKTDETLYLTFLKTLCGIISAMTECAAPPELEAAIKDAPDGFKEEKTKVYETIEFTNCVVLNKTEIKRGSAGTENFSIYCEDATELGRFSLRIYRNHFEDLEKLHESISKYSTLNIFNISISVKEKYFYSTNFETQIIVEPDFIVEASDIAECFANNISNPNIFFIRKLLPSKPGIAAFKGNLINGLMDALIADPGADPEQIIQELIGENLMRVLYYGKEAIEGVVKDIIDIHYKNLILLFKSRKTDRIRIEPTFVSPLYGIHGRLDALIEPEGDTTKKNIFELKSGNAKAKPDVWVNHRMQVTCYNMLLKSAYGKDRKGTSSILYSSTSDSPFRNVACGPAEEKKVISVRNSIVQGLFRLAEGNFEILNLIKSNKAGLIPRFMENSVLDFSDQLKNASDTDARYYRYMLSFVLREHRSAKTGSASGEGSGFSALWAETTEEKKNDFKIITDLKLSEFGPKELKFKFKKPVNHNFRDGDIAIFYRKDGKTSSPVNSELMRGTIQKITNEEVIVDMRNRQVDEDFFAKGSEWIIEHDVIESNFWNTVRLLFEFVKAPKYKRELVLGLREPETGDTKYERDKTLSRDQNECIEKAVKAEDYFLLQGPPGTGKTSTALTGIIKNLIKQNTKMVILAFTNRAVDEICGNLKKNGINFVRTGRHAQSGDGESWGEEFIPMSNIVVSTVTSFISKIHELEGIYEFDTLIVDEASQLTEADISGILVKFRKFILIGDQNQMPSVVTQSPQESEVNDTTLKKLGITNFNRSLFERLYRTCAKKKWAHATGMLETHYRMHKNISDLINVHYGQKLTEGREEQTRDFDIFRKDSENEIERMLAKSRTIFIESKYERTSKTNRDEAVKAVAILKTIKNALGDKFTEKTAGIVTPFRAQIALIKSLINDDELRNKVTIDTVERYQGSERNIIIASFAVHNTYQLNNLQSLNADNVDRKLLVTLSRAASQLIMLGYAPVLKDGVYFKQIMAHILRKGLYVPINDQASVFNGQ